MVGGRETRHKVKILQALAEWKNYRQTISTFTYPEPVIVSTEKPIGLGPDGAATGATRSRVGLKASMRRHTRGIYLGSLGCVLGVRWQVQYCGDIVYTRTSASVD